MLLGFPVLASHNAMAQKGVGGGGGITHAIYSAFMTLDDDLCPFFVLFVFSFFVFFWFFGCFFCFVFVFVLFFCLYVCVCSPFLKDVVYCAWAFPSKATDSRHKLTCRLTFLLVHSIDVIPSSKCDALGFSSTCQS